MGVEESWQLVAEGNPTICERCGNPAHREDKFCGVCGAEMPPDAQAAAPTEEIPTQVHAPQGIPARSGNRRRVLAIAVGALLVLLVGTGAVAYAAFGPSMDSLGWSGSRPSDAEENPPTQEEPAEDTSPESTSIASVSPDDPPDPDFDQLLPAPHAPSNPGPPAKSERTSGSEKSPPTQASRSDLEAEAEEAAGDYYRAAGSEDWGYTYDNLDSQTQALFTREEWDRKNQWLADDNSAVYHLLSVDLEDTSRKPVAEVAVRLTGEDGSSSVRNTRFVLEDGVWKHRFVEEEKDLFMPGKPFEEFVEAR